jgi:anthranilate phosphoribosyltransferase
VIPAFFMVSTTSRITLVVSARDKSAGTALMAAGLAPDIKDGIAVAREVVTSGAALHKLEQLVRFSQA